jgi:hypothetical protein
MTDLHSDLIPCLRGRGRGRALSHPLLVAQPYVEAYNAVYNREYRGKLVELAQAEATGNWSRFIWLHEPAFRVMALQSIAGSMTDQQYWPMVSEVWLDSQTQEHRPWTELWSARRPYRERAMTEDEHRRLAELPDEVPIFHGQRTAKVTGLSWSLLYADALAFAYRPGDGRPCVASAVVRKPRIQALFSRGANHHGSEVIVFPQHRHKLRVIELPLRRRAA